MRHDRRPAPGADAGDGAPAPSGPPPPEPRAPGPARGIRSLSRRTLAICVCVATIGALLAALVASALLDDTADERTEQTAELEPVGAVDLDRMLSVALTTVDGKPTTLAAQLDTRPMVLNIWAQSCVPCVEEMPLLEAAHQANPDVAFLGVDTQDRLDRALELAAQTGITYPWVQDPSGNFFYEAGATGMPTTLLLDRRGRILATRTGAFADQADLQGWIDENRPVS
ncbi:MAG TPA: TlpA disulfide reductase family protein [Acidimicrobiales bacterium]|jgi:cytochrome c biogenesis protein CcmG/thiol:disulfide interchange protein DsbE|nr:TlpA disulfide reductase family protein [Acidimicrobiales bacterium]